DIDGKSQAPGVPWWRIINSKGGISMPTGSNAATEQRQRLESERISFDARGLVDLGTFGWDGPSQAYLDEHNLHKPPGLRKPPGPKQMSLF
ncbi:MAG: hypothetical protein AAF125_23395, partial [Chloroflexota bacterium]